jgi:hypothetical protein
MSTLRKREVKAMRNVLSPLSLILLASAGAASAQPPAATLRPAPDAVSRLQLLAEGPLGLKVEGSAQRGAVANVAGIRSDALLVSQRLDSRTYFVQDQRYGADKAAGFFGGSDDELLARAREVMVALDVPAAEVERASVLREKTQTGYASPFTGKLVTGPVKEGPRTAELMRAVEGVPVFSSRALIGLSRDGAVGNAEIHWPVVSETVLHEAHRLQELVRAGWPAPEQKGARVESVEAGIIHSPAMGFVMDVYPAIRVIYSAENPRMGRKLTLYLDAQGASLPVPRQFEKNGEAPPAPRPRPTENAN